MSTKTATLTLAGDGLRFDAVAGSGHTLVLDDGVGDAGMRPAELIPLAIAGCTAFDVISILRKKQQPVTRYAIHASGEQRDGVHPNLFLAVTLVHEIEGAVDPAAIRRAIELSAGKYCSVGATVASGICTIAHRYRLRTPDGAVHEEDVIVEGPYAGRDALLAERAARPAAG